MIHLNDCMCVLNTLPDKSIDLVVTDPPYKLQSDGGGGTFGSKKRRYHKSYTSLGKLNIDVLKELDRVMKKTNIYIWCNKLQLSMYLNYYEQKGCNCDIICWHKTNSVPTCNNKYLSDTEYCIFARAKGVRVYGEYKTKRKFYVSQLNVKDKKKYKHPTIKPLEIIKNLIINSSKEGDVVLDPFMGSGTTGVAAKELGREFIGVEINEQWFNIAHQRLNEPKQMELL